MKTDIIFYTISQQLESNWWWLSKAGNANYPVHTTYLNREFGIPPFLLEYMTRKGTIFPYARRKRLINSNKGYK